MAPVEIRYYRLYNLSDSDAAIYPQLRETHEPQKNVLWDGQKVGGRRYRTSAGQETIVDLGAIGFSLNLSFFLGWIVEDSEQSTGWTLEQNFVATEDSDLMATAIWRGDRSASTFEYVGTKLYKERFEPRLEQSL